MKKKFLFFLILFFSLFINTNSFATERDYYQELVNDWLKIFPDRNRNAAGPNFLTIS